MTVLWVDGALTSKDDAPSSPLAHTLHYGVGVFEGVRSYDLGDGRAGIFRLEDHLDRLAASATVCGMALGHDREALTRACIDVLRANGLADGYLRPIAYHEEGGLTVGASPPVRTVIAALPWGAYLGDEGVERGIRVCVSAFRRAGLGAAFHKAKICGQYVASVLANRRAEADGYDEAILADEDGTLAEGTGENLFIVRDRLLATPPLDAPILPGITRHTVLTLAHELIAAGEVPLDGIVERRLTRDETMSATEVFLTGTAAEITPVREVDRCTIGDGTPGPVTRALRAAYHELVRARRRAPPHWHTIFTAEAP